ncbi:tetratricopeptide repeat protein [Pseudoduganella aquatica]|uniref:Tetratricopeptide repeat protein n=1 Tax=Pseudoduganella aquatica TaxID=2660641 RepID=A0A7X4HC42_9BURK|nr:tetratricopeptide repeat protein [Pseudoduganella aquatica]MYN08511.1 tetratricopeptide repeat protein [Pseudoduganella aquatica]
MKRFAALFLSVLLAGCASLAPPPPPPQLFHDQLFGQPDADIGPDQIFALTDEMKKYAHSLINSRAKREPQLVLFDALYKRDLLQLEYDSTMTRNAAQTFAARQGNCLSLVVMTAAMAREMDMTVQFQAVTTEESWSRSGNLYFASGHVNLVLGKPRMLDVQSVEPNQYMVVDFEPPADTRNLVTKEISERRIISMFMNNRAAESLSRRELNRAYWWARKAAEADPTFFSPYNTLAIVYQHHGNLQQAEAALRYAHVLQPNNTVAMFNLVQVLDGLGRPLEAAAMREELARLEPYPPFHFFNLGQQAMKEGDYKKARKLFAREVDRAPYYHEFHFWLAVASYQLGDLATADKHMKLARDNSTTRNDHELYAAKLDKLRFQERQRNAYSN